ncbi:MAG: nitronate monooxygenase family protein [Bacteroidales bacterium]|nr:nitronate monooxygenase family protein [Bacteroidales bacterium]
MKLKNNRICKLFGISYPVIQAGMIWCSGWKLASAVSNAGGLGVIGAGSMYPENLQNHIRKCKQATSYPFAVNLPLIYPQIQDHIDMIIAEKVPIVITSAGSPSKYTKLFHDNGILVAHVVSSTKFAVKCEMAGVDVVIAEGFEAGGHNGIDETTTMVLLPSVSKAISIPLIAAGGIASGEAMLAAFALGAEGVQIGSLFAAAEESSAHESFKNEVVKAEEGDTKLALKKLIPVRLLKSPFLTKVEEAESSGMGKEELATLLGKGRARKGMFEGDLVEGELEIGQVASQIMSIRPAAEIIQSIMEEFDKALHKICNSDEHS